MSTKILKFENFEYRATIKYLKRLRYKHIYVDMLDTVGDECVYHIVIKVT